jgi:hypothetical protein
VAELPAACGCEDAAVEWDYNTWGNDTWDYDTRACAGD